MRLSVRTLIITMFAVAALALVPGTATAGGPTSVIVVNPATASTGSLYNSDADYENLRAALEPARNGNADGPPLSEGPGSPGTINVTWLIHDVHVWRVDRINVQEDGTAWVRTYDALAAGESTIDWESPARWHRAADSDEVLAVLDRLGLLDKYDVAEQATAQEPETSGDIAAMPVANSGGAPPETTPGWWWVLPAAVLGIGIGLVGRPFLAKHVRWPGRGPRQQLIDA